MITPKYIYLTVNVHIYKASIFAGKICHCIGKV